MKKITLKIEAPKCGASSDELRQFIADNLGADLDYVGGRLAILPPDTKAVVAKCRRAVRETYEKLTIPWIGTERVCADNKVDLVIDEINRVAESSAKLIEEQADALKTRLPDVIQALGKGANMVELPDPENFKLTVTVGYGEPTAAGRGLPKDANEVEVSKAIAKAEGYENLIEHLINLTEKIGPGKEGSTAALRFKEDAATAAELGVVDKNVLHKLNQLTAGLLSVGKAGSKKSAAKAALVTAIAESAVDPENSTEETTEETTYVAGDVADDAIALI